MRADRLLALLMILQVRGRQTAARLAAELEVTERTIYRDVLALSSAGVPVYTERGPGGGISLLEDYRTNLTGLTADEVRVLFLLSIPAPLTDLGLNEDLQSALRKLAASLPISRLPDANRLQQHIHLDWTAWEGPENTAPHLGVIQQAVLQQRQLRLTYRSPLFGDWIEPLHVLAEPYGLVAKANEWHMVCLVDDIMQVIPISNVLAIEQLETSFSIPPDFDLARFWQEWCANQLKRRPQYTVRVRAFPKVLPMLRRRFANLASDFNAQSQGSNAGIALEFELNFQSLEDARAYLLSCGNAVEVLAPQALRMSLIDYARQIADFYSML